MLVEPVLVAAVPLTVSAPPVGPVVSWTKLSGAPVLAAPAASVEVTVEPGGLPGLAVQLYALEV